MSIKQYGAILSNMNIGRADELSKEQQITKHMLRNGLKNFTIKTALNLYSYLLILLREALENKKAERYILCVSFRNCGCFY